MKLAIMQPYLFPYIGYFQLINAVDVFVVYDDVAFINRGWVNRNRILVNKTAHYFTVPLSGASQNNLINETDIAAELYAQFRKKFFATLKTSYGRAPFFCETVNLVEQVFSPAVAGITDLARQGLEAVCAYLDITTRIVPTSTIYANTQLKKADRLIDICRAESAEIYINAIGGLELYSTEDFKTRGIDLKFIKSKPFEYRQFGDEFVPWLSIIDVMMFNPKDKIIETIQNNYYLL